MKRKICFFSGDISRTGGTERVLLLIANELTKYYDVSIVSYSGGEKTGYYCNDEISLYRLNAGRYSGVLGRKIYPVIALTNFLLQNHQDIFICVDVILYMYCYPIKKIFNTKFVAWEHFNFHVDNGVNNRRIARKLAARNSDQIVVLSQKDLGEYNKYLDVKVPIKCLFNPAVMKIDDNNIIKKKQIIASGRLTYQKNFQELIEIWRDIESKDKDWELLICGEGEDRSEIEKLISDYHLNNVKLLGHCDNIQKMYLESAILVMTSRYEGFPMVLLEGQKCGLPIVAYDCYSGPSEIIIDGENGFLIEYLNRKMFCEKLYQLMSDNRLLNSFSKNAVNDANRYDIDTIINEWMELFEKI